MFWFVENKCPDGLEYLPNDYKKKSISREWLGNMCKVLKWILIGNTLNESDFKEFINNAIKQREKFSLNKNSMEIKVDSRIDNEIQHSSMLSSMLNIFIFNLAEKEEAICYWEIKKKIKLWPD